MWNLCKPCLQRARCIIHSVDPILLTQVILLLCQTSGVALFGRWTTDCMLCIIYLFHFTCSYGIVSVTRWKMPSLCIYMHDMNQRPCWCITTHTSCHIYTHIHTDICAINEIMLHSYIYWNIYIYVFLYLPLFNQRPCWCITTHTSCHIYTHIHTQIYVL